MIRDTAMAAWRGARRSRMRASAATIAVTTASRTMPPMMRTNWPGKRSRSARRISPMKGAARTSTDETADAMTKGRTRNRWCGSAITAAACPLDESGQRDVERARLARAAVPLDENRTLVGPLDDGAGARDVAVGDQEADRSFHPEEPRGRHRDRLRQHRFDHRLAQAERVDQTVEHAHEIVFRVVERLGRNRARIAEDVARLLRQIGRASCRER